LLEQLQSLCHQLRKKEAQPRDVATGMREAGGSAHGHGIEANRLDDRNRRCRLRGRVDSRCGSDDDIDIQTYQLARQTG